MTDDAGATVTNDLHIKLDRSHALSLANLLHILKFVIRMSPATANRDVRRSANCRQSLRNLSGIVMTAARNQNPDSRTPGIVGITVGGNILPLRARFVDERHCFLRASPNRNAAKLDVRDLNWKTRFPADLNCFVQSLKCPISLITNVTDVDATERACGLGQSDYLLSRCRSEEHTSEL